MQKSRFNQLGAPLGPERDVRPPQNPEALIRRLGEAARRLLEDPREARAAAGRMRRGGNADELARAAESLRDLSKLLSRQTSSRDVARPVEPCPPQPERADEPAWTCPEDATPNTPCPEDSELAATDIPEPEVETEPMPDEREIESLNKYETVALLWVEKIGLGRERYELMLQYLREPLTKNNAEGSIKNQIGGVLNRTRMQLFSDRAVLDAIGAMSPIERAFTLMVLGAEYNGGKIVPTRIRNFHPLKDKVMEEYAEQAPAEQGAAAAERARRTKLAEFNGVYELLDTYPGRAHASN